MKSSRSNQGQTKAEISISTMQVQQNKEVEYRQSIYDKLLKAQSEYLSRKKQAAKLPQKYQKPEDLATVDPPQPNFIEVNLMYKYKSVIGSELQRWFLLDDDNFVQFRQKNDKKPSKATPLLGARVIFELKTSTSIKWKELKCSARVIITLLRDKQKKLVYIYHNDHNFLKALAVRVKIASSLDLKNQLQQHMNCLSTMYNIVRFEGFWKLVLDLNIKRTRRLIAFQLMGHNLVDVAGLAWQQNRKIMLSLQKMIDQNPEKSRFVGKLRNIFRFGALKSIFRQNRYPYPVYILNQKALQLLTVIKTRRKMRDVDTQLELEYLCSKDRSGHKASSIQIQQQIDTLQIAQGNIYLNKQNFQLEDRLNLTKNNFNLFAYEEVSYLASDLVVDITKHSEVAQQKEHTIQIFGPLLPQKLVNLNSAVNSAPELHYYAPLNSLKTQYLSVQISQITLPLSFVQKNNENCILRVKLTQLKSQQHQQQNFYVYSPDKLLQIPKAQLIRAEQQRESSIVIQFTHVFNIDRLVDQPLERFTLTINYARINSPLLQPLKEYAIYDQNQGFYVQNTAQQLDYSDTAVTKTLNLIDKTNSKSVATISYQCKTIKNSNQIDFREGNRLLIGRYCIIDPDTPKMRICQVVQYNCDDTVNLRNTLTHKPVEQGNKIPMSRVKLVEKYGVSVYNMNNIPQELQQQLYAWKCTIKSQDKRFINTLQFAIQKRHVELAWQNRQEMKTNVISGELKLSVIDIKVLKKSGGCTDEVKQNLQPIIKIISKEDGDNQKVQLSDRLQNTQKNQLLNIASWVSKSRPLGQIFSIGNFDRQFGAEQQSVIKIEVSNNSKELLGSCELNAIQMISLDKPAQEHSILLQFKGQFAGIITVQTRFIADKATRKHFSITLESSKLSSPEARLHLETILTSKISDKYKYQVPIKQYHWVDHKHQNYLQELLPQRPLVLKDQSEFTQFLSSVYTDGLMKNNLSIKASIGKTSTKTNTDSIRTMKDHLHKLQQEGIFISQHELKDIQVWLMNLKRPVRQEFTCNLINLWQTKKQLIQLQAQEVLTIQYWEKYLQDIGPRKTIQYNETDLDDEGDDDFLMAQVNHLFVKSTIIQKDHQVNQQDLVIKKNPLMHNQKLNQLIYCGSTQGNQNEVEMKNYTDLYSLIHNFGVASNLRSQIWRELLKVQILEYDEVIHFKKMIEQKQFNINWNPNITVYQNYLVLAETVDCLAFRQIDEDVTLYQFTKDYCSMYSLSQQNQIQLSERFMIRQILRTLVLWSRYKKNGLNDLSFCYDMTTLDIIQRLLSITSSDKTKAEDVFWILVGMIRISPLCFSISDSVLKSQDCLSIMRHEMLIMKTLVQQFLPELKSKLKQLGVPLEMLVYKPISSMYANYFSSDLVLRLWDQIFFSIGTLEKQQRKQITWYFVTPAFLVLKKVESQMLQAQTCKDIVQAFDSGRTLWYNPTQFIKDLDQEIKLLWIENIKENKQSFFAHLLFKNNVTIDNKLAYEMEEQRNKYQIKIKAIFKVVQNENIQVASLLKDKQINTQTLQKGLVDQFKAASSGDSFFDTGKLSNLTFKNLVNADLQLLTVHIYIHSLTKMPACKDSKFKLKVSYGVFKGQQNELENVKAVGVLQPKTLFYNSVQIETYTQFQYCAGQNFVLLEILDKNDNLVCDTIISLNLIEQERFVKNYFKFRNPVDTTQSFMFCQGNACVSLFLQKQKPSIINNDNKDRQKILFAFNKRTPDAQDIFNKSENRELQDQFAKLVEFDYFDLKECLSTNAAQEIINESYNYVQLNESLQMREFILMAKQLLPQSLQQNNQLEQIYKAFTGQKTIDQDHKVFNELQDIRKNSIQNVVPLISDTKVKSSQSMAFVKSVHKLLDSDQNALPFCLQQFLTSVVLHSLSTVSDKISILYDLFDLAQRNVAQINISQAYQLLYSVFNRSQYMINQSELMNLCEFLFKGQINMVKQAICTTKDYQEIISLQDFEQKGFAGGAVDVTKMVQQSFNNYFAIFGTKMIDFNLDVTPFREFKDLLSYKEATYLLNQTKAITVKVVIQLIIDGEHIAFELEYEKNQLVRAATQNQNTVSTEVVDIRTYLMRNSCRLLMGGERKIISKNELIQKLNDIPMLANLIRAETLYQDRIKNTLVQRQVDRSTIEVSFTFQKFQFMFTFASKQQETGLLKVSNFAYKQTVAFNLYETTILMELRNKVQSLLSYIKEPEIKQDALIQFVTGEADWQVYSDQEWQSVQDFNTINTLPQASDCICLKLSQLSKHVSPIYDCLSLYKHSDDSYEWRPCRIIKIVKLQAHEVREMIFEEMCNKYTIEFKHLADQGEKMWVTRLATEILFSQDYTRNYQFRFGQESLNYLINLYAGRQ